MGRNKLLLDLGGETLVRRAARGALAASLHPVFVVLGHEAERVREALAGLACETVVNADYARGAGSSLRAGVASVATTGAEALVLTLADMPLVTPEMLATLALRWRETKAAIVVSHYGDAQAPPTLFSRSLFGDLLASEDERGAKSILSRHSESALAVQWPADALQDLDVSADYEQFLARTQR
jgi:molybdenum cofactor cytidylyltransferase